MCDCHFDRFTQRICTADLSKVTFPKKRDLLVMINCGLSEYCARTSLDGMLCRIIMTNNNNNQVDMRHLSMMMMWLGNRQEKFAVLITAVVKWTDAWLAVLLWRVHVKTPVMRHSKWSRWRGCPAADWVGLVDSVASPFMIRQITDIVHNNRYHVIIDMKMETIMTMLWAWNINLIFGSTQYSLKWNLSLPQESGSLRRTGLWMDFNSWVILIEKILFRETEDVQEPSFGYLEYFLITIYSTK